MTTERIAQTFPDIASQGLSTSGTAAGVRSFPQPFIGGGAGGGVGVLIQAAMITLGIGTLISSVTLGTPVDVGKSFIRYRGCNVLGSTEAVNEWRTRHAFSSFVGSIASDVTAERRNSTVRTDVYFTVVTFTGAGGTSADLRIEKGVCITDTTGGIGRPDKDGIFILPLPQLTAAEMARAFVIFRGGEFIPFPGTLGDPCSAGTGTAGGGFCWTLPEHNHARVQLRNNGPFTEVVVDRGTGGYTPGAPFPPPADHCGQSDLEWQVTVVVFP